ncbi:MAG TPA: protein-L-isoaspartate O-methyltransferase [Anaerolineaceae bacterium]|jgi:protein-L-isoaspartate(D-aspartate) O-methyltransferase|nr:protein-L-isoaspartate O-methyltransferase [Anaerolineaceae bacterium]
MDFLDESEYVTRREAMVTEQILSRGIIEPRLIEALRTIPRHLFVPAGYRRYAYSDHPLPIGEGQTISQPYMVALMTSLLQLTGGEKVLEIGTGSGYQAAILSRLAREVHTIEIIPEVARKARKTLDSLGYTGISIHVGDGSLGYPESAPYNAILVTAAARDVPKAFFEQLDPTGRMVIPTGAQSLQHIQLWTHEFNHWEAENILAVSFVPLRGVDGWTREEWPI